jgi:hypothetical protein
MTAREWLIENGYQDVADQINEVLVALKSSASRERRSWWDILSGGRNGKPRIVAGREFPVLYAAQRRQGKPITPNAVRRRKREVPPEIQATGRWKKSPTK